MFYLTDEIYRIINYYASYKCKYLELFTWYDITFVNTFTVVGYILALN